MQPTSPDPKFDFMLKQNAKPKRGLPLPALPKPAKIILAVVGGIFVLVIISSLLSSHKSGGTQPIVNVMARGQEILRVTQLTQQTLPLQDPSTQALAATVYASVSSDEAQLKSYLSKSHIKVSTAALAADTDKTTDSSLQSASQNNGLDSAYVGYLKTALAKYQTDLQTAYKVAGPNGKTILKSAFDSTTTLLASPQLKS
jgi:hypothetical protein